MSKSNPDAVHSHVQIPQSMASAVVVSHREYGEYDEEAGDFASSPPLTTAVAVQDAPVVRKRFSRRFKIFIVTTILIVLVALIWPLVVFLGKKNKPESRSEPLRWEGGPEGQRGDGSGSGHKSKWRSGGRSGRRPDGSGSGSGSWKDRDTPEGGRWRHRDSSERDGGGSSVDSSNVFGDTGSDSTESP